ncbi:hypothetical protein [Actinophytocola gossypii]|uniref:Uncharacterized protein n=1 Tax=Actinophytocola gossypii TaxID=2812003 RepID=A0ABT2JAZ1_9PSEU|nr:hypothetical protein [Actinophytocola gossypii]MCT2585038.1 hypothetical protein [Actinophytocola gossypii]
MKWVTELVGVLLCIQGIGGGVSAVMHGHPSWFVVRHVLPDGAQLPAAIVIALVGGLVLLANSRRRQAS